VDLVAPSSEVGRVHARGTVESSSDPVGKMRELGGAISATFGQRLGLLILESEEVAVLQPSSSPSEDDGEGEHPAHPVPLNLEKEDVVIHKTDARGLSVEMSHDLQLALLVRRHDVRVYRMSAQAVVVMHQRVPLELLAELRTEGELRLWQFSRARAGSFCCLKQPTAAGPATILEFELQAELVVASPPLQLGAGGAIQSRVHSFEWSDDGAHVALGCDDGTVAVHPRGARGADGTPLVRTATATGAQPVVAVRWHPAGAALCVCLLSGELQLFDLRLEPLRILSETAGAPSLPSASLSAHLDYRARPCLMEWCRAEAAPGQPAPAADHLAVVFDRGPLAIVRLEHAAHGAGAEGGASLDALQLVRQRLNAAAACLLRCGANGGPAAVTTADAAAMMGVEHERALELLRALPASMKQVKAQGLLLVVERLLSAARRPELVRAGKQGWAELGAVLHEWWDQLFSATEAPGHAEMLALYVRYFFGVLRCVTHRCVPVSAIHLYFLFVPPCACACACACVRACVRACVSMDVLCIGDDSVVWIPCDHRTGRTCSKTPTTWPSCCLRTRPSWRCLPSWPSGPRCDTF
jgi:hypothetical protein